MDLMKLMREAAPITRELHEFFQEKAPSNAHAAMAAISYVCAMHMAAAKDTDEAIKTIGNLHEAVDVVFDVQVLLSATTDSPLN
jgi:hypothetical protein